jgi:hypothetical protein
MAALNSDAGRHAGAARRREEIASGERRPVTGAKVTTRLLNPIGETAEQRKARHARETGTRESLWR